ncbi:predicted GPI-anchored protein 58 [Numida meleagris]|uniref:predicted GPI-anchored protein 58 n=1 Tax=Numida meleagris TaxID=8996 RepID=UPI000B3D854A|nr:predicted GPI-anchored protein 58 [Numida meleagris]
MFQIEVLQKNGSLRVFGTESMKSFIRQLKVYRFTKRQHDFKTSPSLPEFLAEEEVFVAHWKPTGRAERGPPQEQPRCPAHGRNNCWPDKSLLPADPQVGTQTVASMGPPPPKQPKKAKDQAQAQAGSAPTPPDPAAAPGREECQPLAPSLLPPSSSPTLRAASAPPAYNILPFMPPTFTPGSMWQAFPQPPQESELQDPGTALHYLSQCFAMAMLATAKMTSPTWGPWAASHCSTCTCSSHKAASHCPTCTCSSHRAAPHCSKCTCGSDAVDAGGWPEP